MNIRVLLADDHKIIRDGIKSMLRAEQAIEIVGEASNGRELVNLLPDLATDLILMDVNMPEMDGFETTAYIAKHHPSVKVLVLSMLDHERYITKMLEAGALGYILKNTGREELTHAIKTVASGNLYICSEIAINLLKRNHPVPVKYPITDEPSATAKLSKRELEVLQLLADGLNNTEIAEKLFTSKRTVESHRKNLLAKTESKNTASLIKYALSRGIID